MSRLKDLYWRIIADRSEVQTTVRLIRDAGADSKWKILEVGCGLGRNLQALQQAGYWPVGVDVNANTVSQVKREGFECYQPGDLAVRNVSWDALLMSHIIEHFDFPGMVKMVESYLQQLRPGGFLVIATPLLSSRFYENVDHVRPYPPEAIEEAFGRRGAQVQSQSNYQLELVDLWFRRRPLSVSNCKAMLRTQFSVGKLFWGAVNIALVIVCKLSFRLIARTDGWVGLYRLK